MTLGAEQRHALAMLNALVSQGLATLTFEKVRTDRKLVEVAKIRITDAGQRAIEG
jgi:hypothetical protein